MKHLRLLRHLACATLLLIGLASCTKNTQKSLVPRNSESVALVNLNDLASELGLQSASMKSEIMKYAGLLLSDEEALDALYDDPSLMGLNWEEPASIFRMPNKTWAMALAVEDASLLDSFVDQLAAQQLCSRRQERDGLQWLTLLGDLQVAYSDESLLLVLPSAEVGSPMMLRQWMTQLFDLSEDEQFFAQPVAEQLEVQEGFAKAYTKASALPEELTTLWKHTLAGAPSARELDAMVSLKSADNGLDVRLSLLPSQRAAAEDNQNRALKLDQRLQKINGIYISDNQQIGQITATLGASGEWLLDLIDALPSMKPLLFGLERGIDIRDMLKSVDGDITIALSNLSETSFEDTQFLCLAQSRGYDIPSKFHSWQQTALDYGISLSQQAGNLYSMRGEGKELLWGMEDKTLLIGTQALISQRGFQADADGRQTASLTYDGCYFYASADISSITGKARTPLTQVVSRVVLSSSEADVWTLEIYPADARKPLLHALLQAAMGTIRPTRR